MPEIRDRFEQRVQTVVQGILLSLMLGVGYTLWDLSKIVTRLEVRGELMAREIADMKIETVSIRTQTANAAIAAALAATTAASAAAAAAAAAQTEPRPKK